VRHKDNNLYIVGRIKNLIVLKSGEKISPEEIEDKFNDCPLIKDSLVYLKDEQIILEVFPREIHDLSNDSRDQEIQNFFKKTNAQLPTFMNINKFIIRTVDFKRSPALKILRNQ
jgi:long-chain acyl-CoA synthetase